MNDIEIFAVQCYERALNAVQADPFKFSSEETPCAVCEQIDHPCEDCEVLQNVEFLRKHHIQYCLQACCRRKVFDKQIKKNLALHLVDTVYEEDDANNDAVDQEESQDFHQGEDK